MLARTRLSILLCGVVSVSGAATVSTTLPATSVMSTTGPTQVQALPNPILFVTQVPIPVDFGVIGSTFANHQGDLRSVGRGGDLYIRYPDGVLRNLTAEAGLGVASGIQGAGSIAVRDPAVHWSGNKAVFSMVVGAPASAGASGGPYYFQLYEVTGLVRGQPVVITKVPNQPADYNNVGATYASDGSLIFASDRPRDGQRHLYPARDEYDMAESTTGLWKLNPVTATLTLLQHAPSGSFDPFIDNAGRVVYSRWDHLERDQQNGDVYGDNCSIVEANPYQVFNYASEAANAAHLPDRTEVFPELHYLEDGCLGDGTANAHGVKLFYPWQVNQDGTEEETLNHIGRHEFAGYFTRSFINDPNLRDFAGETSGRANPNEVENLLQLTEDPTWTGRFLAIDSPHFDTHASGQLVRFLAPKGTSAAQVRVEYLTPRSTYQPGQQAGDSGRYRNPAVLSDGQIVVAHSDFTGGVANLGSAGAPIPSHRFRLKRLALGGDGYYAPAENLTPAAGISKEVTYFNNGSVHYNGPLWELSPVEVRARTAPVATTANLEAPEQQAFTQESVNVEQFRQFLRAQNLALVVVRNATTRDRADRQQPYNLRVPGGTQTLGSDGQIYDIAYLQLVQADMLRGWASYPGRRVLAQFLHDPVAQSLNQQPANAPVGSVAIATDGSVAAFVPAQRAMAWQSTDPSGRPVVRERDWVSFQPGEIRSCSGCHGVNSLDQAGQPPATNTPLALRQLLARWRDSQSDQIFAGGFQ